VFRAALAPPGLPRDGDHRGREGQSLQLAQPLLTLVWSVLLMNEHLPITAPLTTVVVLLCIVATQRTRFKHL